MDVVKTRTDLIERAATALGALPSGQSLSDEDRDTIDNLIDPLVMQLGFDNIVLIQDTNAIQNEHFIPLANLLANEAAASFGQQYSFDVRVINEATLHRLASGKATYEVLEIDYF